MTGDRQQSGLPGGLPDPISIPAHGAWGGFSLLEVLIAVLVLSVGLLSLAQLHGFLVQQGSEAKARSVALFLGQAKLEDLRGFNTLRSRPGAFAFADIQTNLGGVLSADLSNSDGVTVYSGTDYSRQWLVEGFCYSGPAVAAVGCAPATPNVPDIKRVTVEIRWVNADGRTRSLSLWTMIAAANPRDAMPFAVVY